MAWGCFSLHGQGRIILILTRDERGGLKEWRGCRIRWTAQVVFEDGGPAALRCDKLWPLRYCYCCGWIGPSAGRGTGKQERAWELYLSNGQAQHVERARQKAGVCADRLWPCRANKARRRPTTSLHCVPKRRHVQVLLTDLRCPARPLDSRQHTLSVSILSAIFQGRPR